MEIVAHEKQSPFASEPIWRLIVRFAVPSVIALLVNSLYNIVDQIFIGNGVGYMGNGATNIVFPITIIALALAMMIGNGGAAFLSLKLGGGNVDSAKQGIGNAVTMSVVVSIILTTVFLIFINPILTLFGATDTLRPYALEILLVASEIISVWRSCCSSSRRCPSYHCLAPRTVCTTNLRSKPSESFCCSAR